MSIVGLFEATCVCDLIHSYTLHCSNSWNCCWDASWEHPWNGKPQKLALKSQMMPQLMVWAVAVCDPWPVSPSQATLYGKLWLASSHPWRKQLRVGTDNWQRICLLTLMGFVSRDRDILYIYIIYINILSLSLSLYRLYNQHTHTLHPTTRIAGKERNRTHVRKHRQLERRRNWQEQRGNEHPQPQPLSPSAPQPSALSLSLTPHAWTYCTYRIQIKDPVTGHPPRKNPA